jgi:hypothetical protein
MKTITVEIKNIEVFPDCEYFGNYSYDFKITVDGKVFAEDTYESDYEDWKAEDFKKALEECAWSYTLGREFEN